MSGRFKSIVFGGWVQGELWTDLIDLHVDLFLCNELPFGGRDDRTCFKIFDGVKFFNRD